MRVLDLFKGGLGQLRTLLLRLIRVTGKGDDLWIHIGIHLLQICAHPENAGSAAPLST